MRYLAFKMAEEHQSGINHIYLASREGSELTQLTTHGLAGGPIHWAPTSSAIAYTYQQTNGNINPWLVTLSE